MVCLVVSPEGDTTQVARAPPRRCSFAESDTSRKQERTANQKQNTGHDETTLGTSSVLLISRSMLASGRALPLLVCSIGNPGAQYANTLHSAGHTVLNRLAQELGYPPFSKERSYGNGLLSKGSNWTLWQSTSYMNESGKGVRAAFLAWSKNLPDGEGRLVIVHDELEKPLGAVSLRTVQGASAKGHNGLKSIMSVIGSTPFVRIGIGIGRPVSRQSDDVARYVLKKMSPAERTTIENSVDQVIAKLNHLDAG